MRFAYLLLAAMVVSSAFVILPPNANIVLTSVLIVYVGSHFALSPSVDDEGGAAGSPEPAMTSKDAAMFPLVGSVALVTLYAAFKFFNRDVVNMLLSVYFTAVGTFALTASLEPALRRALNRALGVRGPEDATLVNWKEDAAW